MSAATNENQTLNVKLVLGFLGKVFKMWANIFTQSGKKETFVLKLLTGNIMRPL